MPADRASPGAPPAGPRAPLARPFLVGFAGGSGAGKTALAAAVRARLGPERVSALAQDAYYRDHPELAPEARARLDFDAPEALDQARFVADLRALRRGEAVTPPVYCFATHRRVGFGPPVEPRPIVLVDGILLFHDGAVRDLLDLRIFVDAPEALRLARRVARDTRERGRTRAAVLRQYQATVRPAHARWVEPTRAWADLVLLNAGRLEAAAEVAAAVIRARLARVAAEPVVA